MIALYPVSDSVRHVRPLSGINLSNIGQELVCVPVRIQSYSLQTKPLLRHLTLSSFLFLLSFEFPPHSTYLLGKL